SVREYARERLAEAGEEAATANRHRDWFLALAVEAEPYLTGIEQASWFDRLDLERGNLRVALTRSVGQGDAEAALRLGGSVWRFWSVRGFLQEGRAQLDLALSLPGTEPHRSVRAAALNAAGALAHDQNDLGKAQLLHEQSLAIARASE